MLLARAGRINVRTTEFTWEIDNFLKYFIESTCVLSPEFHIKSADWLLQMYPKGYYTGITEYVSIFLRLKSDAGFRTNYSISIINKEKLQCNYRICGVREYVSKTPEPGNYYRSWGFVKFILRQEIAMGKERFLQKNKLVILIQLYPNTYNVYNRHLVSFEDVLNNKEFCNVTLNVKRGDQVQYLYAHKSVLTKRSDVFYAMFDHHMKESIDNSVTIEDIEYRVLVELLRFIYTGEVKNIESMVLELLIAADKYAIVDLKDVCGDYFFHNLSDKTAIEYLNLAAHYNVESLLYNAKEYIIENAKRMVESTDFKSIMEMNADDLFDIICALARKSKSANNAA